MNIQSLSFLCLAVLALSACDRRDDDTVPASSSGVTSPPGEAVDSGTDGAATSQAQATPGGLGSPEATEMTPPVPATQCSGKIGDELSDCLQQRQTGGDQAPERQMGPPQSSAPSTPPDSSN